MTPQEFKIKYPQYSDLEGDDLWDMVTEIALQSDNVLTADPKQEKIYHKPINIGGIMVSIEDSSTTRWLNSKGEEVKIKEDVISDKQTTSYKMEIIDFSKL